MARLLRLAKHHGVEPDHIEFSLQVHSLDLSANVDDKLQVILSRGSKTWTGATVSGTSKDGHWQFNFNSAIQITSSMFPSKKGPRKYDAKNAKLVFKRITKNSAKAFGEIELDLAEFCDAENRGRLSRALQKCSDKQARADFSITTSLSQKDVSPSMIDDESMAISPEHSQIESEVAKPSATAPSSSIANPASLKQSWEPQSASKPDEQLPNSPDGNPNGKHPAQSVQLLIALKDDNISRLRKKIDELELLNKSSMSLVTRVNELESQLNKKNQAYDQLKLNSLAMEKMLEQANAQISEFAKDNEESDNEAVKDTIPDLATGGASLPALHDTISELQKENSQLLKEIANMKLDMASREQSYRQELGDLKLELNKEKNEKNDASIKLIEYQKTSKETELMEALELEKVSCESLRGIIRVLQDKSSEQDLCLSKMHDSTEQELAKLREKIIELERSQATLRNESAMLKDSKLNLRDELDRAQQIVSQLSKENEELKQSCSSGMQLISNLQQELKSNAQFISASKSEGELALLEERKHFLSKEDELKLQLQERYAEISNIQHDLALLQLQVEEKEAALGNTIQKLNASHLARCNELNFFCIQLGTMETELTSIQHYLANAEQQSSMIDRLVSEIQSIADKHAICENIQVDLCVQLQEKIRVQSSVISSLKQSHSEEVKSLRLKHSTLSHTSQVLIGQQNSRILEYERLLSTSQNDSTKQLHQLQNQVQSLLHEKAQALLEHDRLCAITKESKKDVKELLQLLSLKEKALEATFTRDRYERSSSDTIANYQQQNAALQRLLSREVDRLGAHFERFNRATKTSAQKNFILEETLHEANKRQQKIEAELLQSQEYSLNTESAVQELQQKVQMMESLAVSEKTKLAKVMMKYETVCHERDCITQSLIMSKFEYAGLHKTSTEKIYSLHAFVKANRTEDEELRPLLKRLYMNEEYFGTRFELATSELRSAISLLRVIITDLQAKTSQLEISKSTLSSKQSDLDQTKEDLLSLQKTLKSTEHQWRQTSLALESCYAEIDDLKADAVSKNQLLLQATSFINLYQKDLNIIQDLHADIASLKTLIFGLESKECNTSSLMQLTQLEASTNLYGLRSVCDLQGAWHESLKDLIASSFGENYKLRQTLLFKENKSKTELQISRSKNEKQQEIIAHTEYRLSQVLRQNHNLYDLNVKLIHSLKASVEISRLMEQQVKSHMITIAALQVDLAKQNEKMSGLKYEYECLMSIQDDGITRKSQGLHAIIASEKAQVHAKQSVLKACQKKVKEYEERNEALPQTQNDTASIHENQIATLSEEWKIKSIQYEDRLQSMEDSMKQTVRQAEELQTELQEQIALSRISDQKVASLQVELDTRGQMLEALEKNKNTQLDNMVQVKKEFENESSQKVEWEKLFEELQTRFDILQRQYEDIKNCKEQQTVMITQLKQNESAKELSMEDQQAELRRAQAFISELQMKLRSMETLKDELENARKVIGNMEHELAIAKREKTATDSEDIQDQATVNLESPSFNRENHHHTLSNVIAEMSSVLQNPPSGMVPNLDQRNQISCTNNPEQNPTDVQTLQHQIKERDEEIAALRKNYESLENLNKHLEERLVNTNVRMSQMQDEENRLEEQVKTLEAVLDNVVQQKAMEVRKK